MDSSDMHLGYNTLDYHPIEFDYGIRPPALPSFSNPPSRYLPRANPSGQRSRSRFATSEVFGALLKVPLAAPD
jgi:hypothetical protein